MTRERALSKSESEEVVNNFRFSRTPLPEVANHPPYKYVRKVHPSVRHIRAYVSTLGAVSMGDLDGDGLRDVVWVDPRTDQVIAVPCPALDALRNIRTHPDHHSPTGTPRQCALRAPLVDLNGDGLMDVLVAGP
jgi:hypothetical protein